MVLSLLKLVVSLNLLSVLLISMVLVKPRPVSYTHLDVYKRQGVACEKAGFKTCCPTTPLTATGTLADTILYNDVELDLITITGSPFERTWNIKFKPENIYGGDHHTKIYFSEPIPQWADSEVLNMEQYLICLLYTSPGLVL